MNKLSEKLKALGSAVAAIEKQFGKGAVMRLGDEEAAAPAPSLPSGSVVRTEG